VTNDEIMTLFREQDKYLKFGDFLEHTIEFYWEDEEEECELNLNLFTAEKEM